MWMVDLDTRGLCAEPSSFRPQQQMRLTGGGSAQSCACQPCDLPHGERETGADEGRKGGEGEGDSGRREGQ
jgi:hypothetical protein